MGNDGVVHLAFKHEAMAAGDYLTAIADDLKAIEAMGAALEGTGKPFVGTGGTLMLAHAGITGRALVLILSPVTRAACAGHLSSA